MLIKSETHKRSLDDSWITPLAIEIVVSMPDAIEVLPQELKKGILRNNSS